MPDDDGFSLKLPPVRLPSLFPENFRVLWPAPGDGPDSRPSPWTIFAALLLFDVADAALALFVGSAAVTAVRVVGGALVAAVAFGTLGTVYVWEAVAALAGFGDFTVVPTLTVLALLRLLR